MTNAQDNAQIDLTEAQRKQTQVNTILSLAETLDNETIVQTICEILDLDYEEIKDKLSDDEELDNQNALDLLDGMETDDSEESDADTGGVSAEEEATQNQVLEMLENLLKEVENAE